mgnify:CR=1 FL=1
MVAREIGDEDYQAKVLVMLAFHLAESLFQEAFVVIKGIRAKWRQAEVVAELLPYLPEAKRDELLQEALMAAWKIEANWRRAEVLAKLAPHLPAAKQVKVLQNVLVAVQKIEDEDHRIEVLAEIAHYLPEPLLREALAKAQEIKWDVYRGKVLAALVPRLAELGYPQEALATVQEIRDKDNRAEALSRLARYLPPPFFTGSFEGNTGTKR